MSIYKLNQTHSKASPLLYNNSVFYNFNLGTSFQALIETFYVSGNRTLPPLLKIMQSFILVQNTLKNNLIHGGEIFGAPFFKKVPFLANIQHYPNVTDWTLFFLNYAERKSFRDNIEYFTLRC